MAATVSAWSKPGAWALDSEQHEDELIQQEQPKPKPEPPSSDFPTLSAALTTKTKKKKAIAVSLSEFATGKQVTHGSAPKYQPSRGLTTEDLLVLPTGPRERTAEELERGSGVRLGGGFRSFEGGSGRGSGSGGSRYSNGGGEDSSRGFSRERESGPSRADENDDWGATKKSSMGGSGFERRERGGGGGGGFFDSQSRADDSDSWVSNKTRVGGAAPPQRRERRGGFEFQKDGLSNGGGADSENWGRKREEGGGVANGRPRLNLQPKTVSANGEEEEKIGINGNGGKSKGSNPFGEARPREEVLAEKGEDWKKIDEQIGNGKVKEMGASDEQQQLELLKIKETKRSSNPFGAARPREEVLAEKGQDWKKIDEQLESAKIKEMGSGDGFGSKATSNGNGRVRSPPEQRAERSWRKPEAVGVAPPSAEKVEDGPVDSAEKVEDDITPEAEN